MIAKKKSASLAYVPPYADHPDLVHAAKRCKACPLYKNATQTVFGEGAVKTATIMLVGEQPGDQEDKEGHPFVGPAGRVLDSLLAAAGVDRERVYVTNAVKHFKWEPRGKRRMHQRPNIMEVDACAGWLEAEMALVKPLVIVCLGSTAAQALMGRGFKVTEQRGQVFEGAPWSRWILATYHPSALLRMMRDREAYEDAKAKLVEDLARAQALVTGRRSRGAPSSRSRGSAEPRGPRADRARRGPTSARPSRGTARSAPASRGG